MKCQICQTNIQSHKSYQVSTVRIKEAMFTEELEAILPKLKLIKCNNCHSIVCADSRRDQSLLNKIYSDLPESYWTTLSSHKDFAKKLDDYLSKYAPNKEDLWDIGCGNGSILSLLNNKYNKSGIEIGQKAVAAAKKKDLNVLEGTASGLGLKNVAEIIICIDVMEHLLDPMQELEAMYEMLKPGGVAFFFTGNADSINARLNKQNWYYLHCVGHVSVFSKKAFEIALPKAGFQSISIHSIPHEASVSLQKWAKYTLSNLIRNKTNPVPYFHDHQLVIASKSDLA